MSLVYEKRSLIVAFGFAFRLVSLCAGQWLKHRTNTKVNERDKAKSQPTSDSG